MARRAHRAIRRQRQQAFVFRAWGGARPGAGRKPKGARAGVEHLTRPALAARFPVHVTWRMEPHVWNLRTRRCFRVLERAMYAGAARFGFRLVHYAVMGNHVHMLVEAPDHRALGRAMKGLGVRIARGLNGIMQRGGRVIGDRYHAHTLRTPSEVRRARAYLLTNAHHHYGRGTTPDPFASRAPVLAPRTWLLRRAPT
jgi:putative transposase